MLEAVICPPPLLRTPDAQITSALLFFDRVYMLPTVDWEDRALKADAWLAGQAMLAYIRDHPSEYDATVQGGSFEGKLNLPDDLPESAVWIDSAEAIHQVAEFFGRTSSLRDAGVIGDLPAPEHVSDVFPTIDAQALVTAVYDSSIDVFNTLSESSTLFGVHDIQVGDSSWALDRGLAHEDQVRVIRCLLGILTYLYYASLAATRALPLLLFRRGHAVVSARLLSLLNIRQKKHPDADVFRLFSAVMRVALPAFTARDFDAILELRHQLNRHGELGMFREYLSAEVVLRHVAIEDPASATHYVATILMPQVKAIESAVRGRWSTLRKHVYEQTMADLWKDVLAYSASGYLFGQPLAGLLLAVAGTLFKAEKATQQEVETVSPAFHQLQYVVQLRARSETA